MRSPINIVLSISKDEAVAWDRMCAKERLELSLREKGHSVPYTEWEKATTNLLGIFPNPPLQTQPYI